MAIEVKNNKIILIARGCVGLGYAVIPFGHNFKGTIDSIENFILYRKAGRVYAREKTERDSRIVTQAMEVQKCFNSIVEQGGEERKVTAAYIGEYNINKETIIFPGGICIWAKGDGPLQRFQEIMFSLSPGAHVIIGKKVQKSIKCVMNVYVLYMNNNGELVEKESENLKELLFFAAENKAVAGNQVEDLIEEEVKKSKAKILLEAIFR
ncbi:MAG: hypothetical protein ACM3UU_00345 [Ignavibacteriales bacterium]